MRILDILNSPKIQSGFLFKKYIKNKTKEEKSDTEKPAYDPSKPAKVPMEFHGIVNVQAVEEELKRMKTDQTGCFTRGELKK
mgnify:CR=1 FL=1